MTLLKLVLVCLFFLTHAPQLFSQNLSAAVTLGYRFGGNMGKGYLYEPTEPRDEMIYTDAVTYGLLLDYGISGDLFIEIFADRQANQIKNRAGNYVFPVASLDIFTDYYHAGIGSRSVSLGGTFFFGGTLGMTNIIPREGDIKSDQFFSFGPFVGFEAQISEILALHAHSRLLLTTMNGNNGILESPDGPVFFFEDTILVQADFTLGIVFYLAGSGYH